MRNAPNCQESLLISLVLMISHRSGKTLLSQIHVFTCNLPLQITPFPVCPGLQAHEKLPTVFEQVAVPVAQLSVPVAHSSMSETTNKNSFRENSTNIFLELIHIQTWNEFQ